MAGERRAIRSRSRPVGGAELATICLVVVACRLLASIPCHFYDDAFITLRYAENLAAERGFVYNPGAPWEPLLGTTTPAFTVILAAARLLRADLATFAVVFNALCDAAIVWLIVRRVLPMSRIASLTAVALFAVLPELNRISAGGMESPLFVLCALGSVCLAHARRPVPAGLLAAFTAAVRPEGVLLFPLLAWRSMRDWRTLLRFCLPAASVGLVYLVVMTAYFGSAIPHSVVAKAVHHVGHGSGRALRILTESFAPSAPLLVLLPLTLVGCGRLLVFGRTARGFTLFALALTGAYLLARPAVWGWYFYPALTAVCIWAGAGVAVVVRRLSHHLTETLESRRARRVEMAICVACVVPVAGFAWYRGPSPVRRDIYRPMAAWARAQDTGEVSILAYDIGAIGYYTGARILDAAGLVWPEAVHERSIPRLLEEHQPDYALVTAVASNVAALRDDPFAASHYVPIRRFNTLGEADLTPSARSLPVHWRQDYLLYARADVLAEAAQALSRADSE